MSIKYRRKIRSTRNSCFYPNNNVDLFEAQKLLNTDAVSNSVNFYNKQQTLLHYMNIVKVLLDKGTNTGTSDINSKKNDRYLRTFG